MAAKRSTARNLVTLAVALVIFGAAAIIAWPKVQQSLLVSEQNRQLEAAEVWSKTFNETLAREERFLGLAATAVPDEGPPPSAYIVVGGNVYDDAAVSAVKDWVSKSAPPVEVRYEVQNVNKPAG